MTLPVRRLYVPDVLWDHGYFPLLWGDDDQGQAIWTNWPLPKYWVYEEIQIGDLQYILLRASEFQPDKPVPEGETP